MHERGALKALAAINHLAAAVSQPNNSSPDLSPDEEGVHPRGC
jgi:hypothetical protein